MIFLITLLIHISSFIPFFYIVNLPSSWITRVSTLHTKAIGNTNGGNINKRRQRFFFLGCSSQNSYDCHLNGDLAILAIKIMMIYIRDNIKMYIHGKNMCVRRMLELVTCRRAAGDGDGGGS